MKTKISLVFFLTVLFVFLNGFDAMAGKKKIRFIVQNLTQIYL